MAIITESDDNVFDLKVSQSSDKFSQQEIDQINNALEKYITEDSDYFAQLMAENPDMTLDYLIDNLKADPTNKDKYKDGVWDYILEKDLNSLAQKSEYLANIEELKKDLKELEVEITSQGFVTMMQKVDTNPKLDKNNIPQYKNDIATSYLEGYRENLTNGTPNDDQLIIDELTKAVSDEFNINTLVDDLRSNYPIQGVVVAPTTNKIIFIKFDRQDYSEDSDNGGSEQDDPDSENTSDGMPIDGAVNFSSYTGTDNKVSGLSSIYDPDCEDCGKGEITQTITSRISQTITDPTKGGYGPGPVEVDETDNEDRGYVGINTAAIKPTSNATVAYLSAEDHYVHNNDENSEDTEGDIESARKAVRRFLKGKEKDLDIVDKDEKLSKEQKKELKELKKVIMGDGLVFKGIGLEEFGNVFVTMTQIYDKNGSAPIDTKGYREKYNETQDITTEMKSESREAKKLAILGRHFIKWRKQEYNGKYIERLFDLINDQIVNAGQAGSFDFASAYNNRNDNKPVILEGAEERLVEEKDSKGVRELIALNGDEGVFMDIMVMVRQSKRGDVDMNKVINAVHDETNNKILGVKLNDAEKKIAQYCIDHGMYKSPSNNDSYRMIAEALASGMEPEDVSNMKTILQSATIDDQRFGDPRTDGKISPSSQFVYWIGDHSVDGKVGFNDRAMISGLQLQEKFRSATTNLAYAKYNNDFRPAEREIVANILCYTSIVAEKSGDLYFYNIIQDQLTASGAQKGPDGQRDPSTINVAALMDIESGLLAQHPGVMNYIQNVMSRPAIPVDAIMEYGASAFSKWHEVTKQSYEEYGSKVNITPDQLEKISSMADGEWRLLVQNATELGVQKYLEGQREHFMTQFGSAVLAMSGGAGVAVGVGFERLLAKLDSDGDHTLSTGLQVGIVNGVPTLGVGLHYHGEMGAGWSLDASTGVAANIVTGFIPLPLSGVALSKERDINKDEIRKNLEARGYQTLHVGPEVKLIGFIPTVGIHAGLDINRMKGIDEQYISIRKSMDVISTALVNADWADVEGNALDVKTAVQKNIALTKNILLNSRKFSNTDPVIMNTMAENLYKAVVHFGCLGIASSWEKTRASAMLAEYFALEWKNQAVERLKGGFSGFDIGLDRVIGTMIFLPSAAISFEKYYGLRYEDTNESKEQQRMAEERGYGNRLLNPDKPAIEQSEIDYLNNMLSTAARHETYQELLNDENGKISIIDDTVMRIPRALFSNNILNVKIDESLKGKVRYDEEGNLYVPKNQLFRFADFSKSQHTEYVLNIGNDNTEVDSYHLIMGREDGLREQGWLCDSDKIKSLDDYKKFVAETVDVDKELIITPTVLQKEFNNISQKTNYDHFPFFQVKSPVDAKGRIKVVITTPGVISKVSPDADSQALIGKDANGKSAGYINFPTTGTVTVHEKILDNGKSEFRFSHTATTTPLTLRYTTERLKPAAESMLTINKINNHPSMLGLYAKSNFPLSTAADIQDGKVSFTINDNISINSNDPLLSLEDETLSVPLGRKLRIDYNSLTNTYSAWTELLAEPSLESIACAFRITDGEVTEEYDGSVDIDILSSLQSLRNTLATIDPNNSLSELEDVSVNGDLYYKLMEAVNSSRVSTITNTNIDTAFGLLQTMLTNGLKNQKSAPVAQSLLDVVGDIAPGDYTSKTYLINRLKQKLSSEPNYAGQKIDTLYEKRKESYGALIAKEVGLSSFATNDRYKSKFSEVMASNFDAGKSVRNTSVIGFSAYYRNNSGKTENKGFSLSGLGDVNVYDNALKTLYDNEETLAKTWFIDKLQKNENEFALVKQSYEDAICSIPGSENETLTSDNFMKLLRGEEAILNNGVTLQFENEMVAYLQGECCNQGIGMRIGTVNYTTPAGIAEREGQRQQAIISETGVLDPAVVNVVGSVKGGVIEVNTQHTRSAANKSRNQFVVGASFALGKRRIYEPDAVSNPGDSRHPDMPGTGGDTGPGDGNNPDPNANTTDAGKR